MTTKFDKVMQNLQDSLDTSVDIEGVEWCHVKRCELIAMIDLALSVSKNDVRGISKDLSRAFSKLCACADE